MLSAGTADEPVAEEARITADAMGSFVDAHYDCGVAGLHRLLSALPVLREADAVVVAAGMEGALPSVVGGLVDAPVIAVPTSVGYGASFEGVAPLPPRIVPPRGQEVRAPTVRLTIRHRFGPYEIR